MSSKPGPLYLDCNASNPIDERVADAIADAYRNLVGNAGSPHEHGQRAKLAVQEARDQVGRVVDAKRHEVLFTSGATESNNLAILGMAAHGRSIGKTHLVGTAIEHKAVLEPLQRLGEQGFEVTLVRPSSDGRVDADALARAIRSDTLMVTMMHVNNETGVVQPIDEVAGIAQELGVWMHVDAAQGYGREFERLRHPGITTISISGHKIFGPQGVGALIVRRDRNKLPPLEAVMVGGGQELGLRSGTLPVPLIIGLGVAAEIAMNEHEDRRRKCLELRGILERWIEARGGVVHGSGAERLPHVVNVSFPGWDADELMESVKDYISISDGAACTSVCATASHVLGAMGIRDPELSGAVRWSWSHRTDTESLREALSAVGAILGKTNP